MYHSELISSNDFKTIVDASILDSSLSFQKNCDKKTAECILLTGATGFLGGYILYELIQKTDAKIICFARPLKGVKPIDRILKNFEKYSFSTSNVVDRIEVLDAKITEQKFGLDSLLYERLTKEIDSIYNNAASVDLVAPFSELVHINVGVSKELLLFASKCRLLHFNHISTVGVFLSNIKSVYGSILHDHPDLLPMGYQRTKWAAEKLMLQAKERGLPLKIFRPGAIVGSEELGICPKNELLPCRWIKGMIQMGCYPNRDLLYPYIPVDVCAKAIVALGEDDSKLLNIELIPSNPLSSKEEYTLLKEVGYSLEEVSYDTWRDKLSKVTFRNVIIERIKILEDVTYNNKQYDFLGIMDSKIIRSICVENTQIELDRYSISLNINHRKWLQGMFRHFNQKGFFPQP